MTGARYPASCTWLCWHTVPQINQCFLMTAKFVVIQGGQIRSIQLKSCHCKTACVLSWAENIKFYHTSNFHQPIDMSRAIFTSPVYGSVGLQTHTFHFISSNHGLHINNKLVETFYIFSQIVANLYPIWRRSSFANVLLPQGHQNDSNGNILIFIYSYFIVIL